MTVPMLGFRRRLEQVTGGADTTPLALLFALNFVDEFDQALFGVLAPNIRDTFDISETTLTSIAAAAIGLVVLLIVPVGVLADRYNRVRLATVAAFFWATFTIVSGLSGWLEIIVLLGIGRFFAGLGRVMNEPVHVSLLADYYEPSTHGRVFSLHRMANPLGFLSILVGGTLAELFGWELTMVLIALPTFVVVAFVSRMQEPVRGASVNYSLAEQAERAGDHVPFWEAFRRLRSIPTMRRFWVAAFLLGAAIIPIAVFFGFFYEHVYNVEREGVWGRAGVLAVYGVGAVVGLMISSRLSDRTIASGNIPRLTIIGGWTLVGLGGSLLGMAAAPWIGLSIAFAFGIGITASGFNSYYLPLVALVAPARLRSQAMGWVGFWFAIGAILLAGFVSGIGEEAGYRWAIGLLSILVVLAGWVFARSERFIRDDVLRALENLSG
jgi:MFS family permease